VFALRQPHELLAEVSSLQQSEERVRRTGQSFGHGLTVFERSGRRHRAQLLQRVRPAIEVLSATEYLIDLVNYVEECGDFGFGWECLVYGYPSSTLVTTPYFQDPRNTFTHVLQPWESSVIRTHVTVTARSPLAAAYSLPSATSRFARVD